ncbi:VOC family protein [Streptomyces sp. KL116D]|uniref:VOC family protein n=1 Tax=Streptomyces sp. KL116D TaxID=3045152 RepID=UPI0035590836
MRRSGARSEPGDGEVPRALELATASEAHHAELVERLKGLGATTADAGRGAAVPWTVMADPEGNMFSVLEPRELYRDTRADRRR